VVVECVLKLEAMLRCKQELATAARCVAAGGGSGRSWRARERAAGERNMAGVGGGRRVDVIPARGSAVAAAERRPGAKDCRRQERNRAEHVLGEEEERGGGPGDLFGIFKDFRDLSVKKDFLLI
jgi:hypothetical protein